MSVPHRKIRWGVLGYARIARESVIPAIQRSPNSEFVAIASRESSKLAECQARFKNPKAYPGYAELLADPEIDAIYIPLPNALHREWTLRAAEKGKHVLCEKPIALSAAECREMIATCAARRVVLMEAFMYRYSDRTRKVLEVIRSGVLGEIKFIHSCFRFLLGNPASIKLRPELGGGSMYDVGCYPLNFTGMVLDEVARLAGEDAAPTPASIAVECVKTNGIDVLFSALLKYPTGVIASLHSGFNAQKRVYSEIVGTQGVLEIPDTFFENPGALLLTVGEERREIAIEASDRYGLEVQDFAAAILEGRSPRCSLAETLRNMELMDQIFAAAK